MGVSKGEEGVGIAPEWVAVSSFGRRRSLSDLVVWGFPEFSRKIFPLKPFFPLPNLFSPHLSPPSNSSAPQTPPYNSLAQAFSSPCYPFPLLFLLQTPSYLLKAPIRPPPNTFGIPP